MPKLDTGKPGRGGRLLSVRVGRVLGGEDFTLMAGGLDVASEINDGLWRRF